MLEFNGKKPIRKNLTIEPIVLSDKQNQQLDKIMKSKKGTIYKRWKVRKVMISNTGSAGGSCCICRKLTNTYSKVSCRRLLSSSKILF